MTQRNVFTTPYRIVLSCCAAVLLAACGGTSDPSDQEVLAASVVSEPVTFGAQAAAGATAQDTSQEPVTAPADEAADASATPAVTPAPVTGAAPAPTDQFNLDGYQTAAPTDVADDGQPATPPPAA